MKRGNHETKCSHFEVNYPDQRYFIGKFSSEIRSVTNCELMAFWSKPLNGHDLAIHIHKPKRIK